MPTTDPPDMLPPSATAPAFRSYTIAEALRSWLDDTTIPPALHNLLKYASVAHEEITRARDALEGDLADRRESFEILSERFTEMERDRNQTLTLLKREQAWAKTLVGEAARFERERDAAQQEARDLEKTITELQKTQLATLLDERNQCVTLLMECEVAIRAATELDAKLRTFLTNTGA